MITKHPSSPKNVSFLSGEGNDRRMDLGKRTLVRSIERDGVWEIVGSEIDLVFVVDSCERFPLGRRGWRTRPTRELRQVRGREVEVRGRRGRLVDGDWAGVVVVRNVIPPVQTFGKFLDSLSEGEIFYSKSLRQ